MNKYHAKGLHTPDGFFHSQKEYKRWLELKLLLKAAQIEFLERQITFKLSVNGVPICKYIADFQYTENDQLIIEDVKGMKSGTPYEMFKLKKRLMLACHGIEVREI